MKNYWGLRKENKKEKCKILKNLLCMKFEMLKYHNSDIYLQYKEREYKALKSGKPSGDQLIIERKLPKDLNFSITYMCITELIEKRNLGKLIIFLRRLVKYIKKNSLKPTTFEENVKKISDSFEKIEGDEFYIASFGNYIIENSHLPFSSISIKINNFSDSLCMVNFILVFKDKIKQKLQNIVLKEYNGRTVLPLAGIGINGNHATSTNYSKGIMKEKKYIEQCTEIKWNFLKYVNKELKLPTFLFKYNIPAPSYVFCKINPKYLSNNTNKKRYDMSNFAILSNNKIDISTHKLKAEINFPEIFEPIIKNYSCYQCFYSGSNEELETKLTNIENELLEGNYSLELIKRLELVAHLSYELHLRSENYFHMIMKVKMHRFNFHKIAYRNFNVNKTFYELESVCREIDIKLLDSLADTNDLNDNIDLSGVKLFEKNIVNKLIQINKRVVLVHKMVNEKISLIQSVSTIKHEMLLTWVAILSLIFSMIAASPYISPYIPKTIKDFFTKVLTTIFATHF